MVKKKTKETTKLSHHPKFKKVMHEYGKGELHSGSKHGPKVTSQEQAVAIALAQAREEEKKKHHRILGRHKK